MPGSRRVEEVMTPDPVTIAPDLTVGDAYKMMRERGFRHLPVVEDGKLVGIISVTDIGRAGAGVASVTALKVSALMTRDPLRVEADARVEVAAATMAARKINCLLICDADGGVAGIVTTYDLLDALAQMLRDGG